MAIQILSQVNQSLSDTDSLPVSLACPEVQSKLQERTQQQSNSKTDPPEASFSSEIQTEYSMIFRTIPSLVLIKLSPP